MRKFKWAAALSIVLVFGMTACDDNDVEVSGTDIFDSTLSDDVIGSLPVIGSATIKDVGEWDSDMAMYGDYVYVVDYGSNAVHRIDMRGNKLEKNYIDLGQDAGPYAVYADKDAVYVMCQGKNPQVLKVEHADKSQSQVLAAADELKAPTDAVTAEGCLFVADSEYNMASPKDTEGSVIAVTSDGKKVVRKTSNPNPSFLYAIGKGKDAMIVSIDAGIIDFSTSKPPEKSCAEVWKLSEFIQSDTGAASRLFCVKDMSLGRMAVTEKDVIFGNPMAPSIYKMSLDDLKNAESSDELIKEVPLSAEKYMTMMMPLAVKEEAVVFDNNKNAVVWGLDTDADRYYLTKSEAAPKGPIDAVYNEKNASIYVLNAASGTVDVLKVK